MRGLAYVAGVGVVERSRAGAGVEMADVGIVERLPEVVKGVRSRTSGKMIRTLFFEAY